MDEQQPVVEQEATISEMETVETKMSYEDLMAEVNRLKSEIEPVVAKNKELLGEKKTAQKKQEEAERARLEGEGQYKTLLEMEQQAKQDAESKLKNTLDKIRSKEVQMASLRLAGEMAEGDNIELLSDFVSRKVNELADDEGNVDAKTLAAIKKEFESNKKYRSLMKQSKAGGGGAPGQQTNGGAGGNELTMEEFNKLSNEEKLKFSQQINAGKATIL